MGDHRDLKILVGCREELDFPLEFIPDNIVPCGPILRAVRPVSQSDAELDQWLARGPTILINLGSHCWTEEHHAVDMARALRRLFDEEKRITGRRRLRVLWKLRQVPQGEILALAHLSTYSVHKRGDPVHDIIGRELDEDMVRISPWLGSEPYAAMQTGHVVCNINHGGANSFWEAFV